MMIKVTPDVSSHTITVQIGKERHVLDMTRAKGLRQALDDAIRDFEQEFGRRWSGDTTRNPSDHSGS